MNIFTQKRIGGILPIFKFILPLIFLILQLGISAQESNGVIDIFPMVSKTVSYVNTVVTTDRLGRLAGQESQVTLNYTPLSNGVMSVSYTRHFNRTSEGIINPYRIAFQYKVIKNDDGSIEVEPKTVADPFLFNNRNPNAYDFEGGFIDYPSVLQVGDRLNQVNCVYSFSISKDLPLAKYIINLTNREVVRKELVNIDEKQYEAFVITYHLEVITSAGDIAALNKKYNADVEEWIVPGLGKVKQINSLNSLSIKGLK